MTLHFDDRTLAILEQVRACRKEGQKIYLVGGAVRDAILSKPLIDLDFVSNSGSMGLARCVQRALNGESYTLDDQRHSARVILDRGKQTELILDFVVFTGENLMEDLRQRDFTINAMAVDLDATGILIDPLHGEESLEAKEIRIADDNSISTDPLRAIRALRFSRSLGFSLGQETLEKIRENASRLEQVASERVRDELFKLLCLPEPTGSIVLLDELTLIPYIFPDLDKLRLFPRIDPHVHSLWHHSMALVNHIESLVDYIFKGDQPTDEYLRQACEQLSTHREELANHLRRPIQPERSRIALLCVAAVYHDVGKPLTMRTDPDGSVHFFQHPLHAEESITKVGTRLALSNAEIEYLLKLVRNHMRIHNLTSGDKITDRAIYRYFQELGAYGVDMALLSMADTLAAKEEFLSKEDWQKEVDAGVGMIRAWFDRKNQVVQPQKLIDGFELQQALNLEPGRRLGQLLVAIREAQAAGELHTKLDVIAYAREFIAHKLGD